MTFTFTDKLPIIDRQGTSWRHSQSLKMNYILNLRDFLTPAPFLDFKVSLNTAYHYLKISLLRVAPKSLE